MVTLIIVLLAITLLVLATVFFLEKRRNAREKKTAEDSFINPHILSLEDCGSILKIQCIKGDKIQLSFMELVDYIERNKEIDVLFSIYSFDLWYKITCVPSEFQHNGGIFILQNNNGKLYFTPYKWEAHRETCVPLKAMKRDVIKLAEA